MKRILMAALAPLLLLAACRNGAGGVLRNQTDTLSYVIGMNAARNMLRIDSTLDVEAVCAAMRDVFRGEEKMSMEQAAAFYREYYHVTRLERIAEASEAFLAAVMRDNSAVRRTPSGLIYHVTRSGPGPRAKADADTVRVMFRGSLRDGSAFQSTYEAGDTLSYALGEVIEGWREGLGLVGAGGAITLWIPAELAYGREGNRLVGPNEALRYDIEVVEVVPAAADGGGR